MFAQHAMRCAPLLTPRLLGSEDPQLDIADVATSQQVHSIPCSAPMNTVSWHPTRHLLAYAGDDKNKVGQDEGNLRIFGFS